MLYEVITNSPPPSEVYGTKEPRIGLLTKPVYMNWLRSSFANRLASA